MGYCNLQIYCQNIPQFKRCEPKYFYLDVQSTLKYWKTRWPTSPVASSQLDSCKMQHTQTCTSLDVSCCSDIRFNTNTRSWLIIVVMNYIQFDTRVCCCYVLLLWCLLITYYGYTSMYLDLLIISLIHLHVIECVLLSLYSFQYMPISLGVLCFR